MSAADSSPDLASKAVCASRLERAIRLYDRVEAECDRFDREVEQPGYCALAALLEALPSEPPPPHEESATTFLSYENDVVRLNTRSAGVAAIARRVADDPSWADMGDAAWRQAHCEIAAAHTRRDQTVAQQEARRRTAETKARTACGIDAIIARSNALADRRHSLWRHVIAAPAASLADVVMKLAFVDRTNDGEADRDTLAAIGSDLRRLIDQERHAASCA